MFSGVSFSLGGQKRWNLLQLIMSIIGARMVVLCGNRVSVNFEGQRLVTSLIKAIKWKYSHLRARALELSKVWICIYIYKFMNYIQVLNYNHKCKLVCVYQSQTHGFDSLCRSSLRSVISIFVPFPKMFVVDPWHWPKSDHSECFHAKFYLRIQPSLIFNLHT